jgi:uncharacterized membrane protein YeaQ/YmgE (transglycosylase-associated protein family)
MRARLKVFFSSQLWMTTPPRETIGRDKDHCTGHRCEFTVSSSSLFMLHVVWSIVVGFIVGLIASAIMHTHLGFVGTTLLGIVGSVIGGLIARLFSKPPAGSKFHPAGFLLSIIGAIVLVLIARLIS